MKRAQVVWPAGEDLCERFRVALREAIDSPLPLVVVLKYLKRMRKEEIAFAFAWLDRLDAGIFPTVKP